jgi:two-component system, chemotaxis family, sensor kinase CheA
MIDYGAQYREEATELITGLESSLLELERNPHDLDLIGRIFRALHTIKGSGAMFGFEIIASFTHEVENAFDLVRDGKLAVTRELIALTLAARDHITALLSDETAPGGDAILNDLQRLVTTNLAPDAATATPAGGGEPDCPQPPPGAPSVFRIRYTPGRECLLNGGNPLLLLRELAALGDARIAARTGAVPALASLDPELCYLGWDVVLTANCGADAIQDVFIFVEEDAEVAIQPAGDDGPPRLGEIPVERGGVTSAQGDEALQQRPRTGEPPVNGGAVDPERVQPAVLEQERVKEVHEPQEQAATLASIRVPAEKLDSLVNIVGELVTVQARLTQLGVSSGDPELMFVAEEVERLTGQLRDNTMSIRLLPIGSTFGRFRRVVHDLSRDLNKEVELIMEGGETELDKTVIERLTDPLVHLIRNSLDHGLEPAEERVAAGKPPQGRIRLSAAHSGTNVVIAISDDGRGLDIAAIRQRAIERGLTTAGATLTEQQIFAFILAPGFSTARTVTGISGRGVGMDVVRSNIEALRGSLHLASTPGAGTTVTLRLPLTLAIIEGLLVRAGDEAFVLPLSNILECIEFGPAERAANGRNLVLVREEAVGCIRLREVFGIPGEPPELEQVVIAETAQGKYGFVVDVVVGDHQTVIKPLSSFYRQVQTISGATVLGDGSVALIVDLEKLAGEVLRDTGNRRPHRAGSVPGPVLAVA